MILEGTRGMYGNYFKRLIDSLSYKYDLIYSEGVLAI
jgi:hypothetical protein